VWLSRYPRPQYIGFDNGGEFKSVFDQLCKEYGIEKKPSTEYNPQSNGVIERVHQTLNNALKTFELDEQELSETNPWAPFLSATAWALRSTYHLALDATPGQVVFGRDMILPIRYRTDWAQLKHRFQERINKDNVRENSKRITYTYKVGDKVLLSKPGILRKMERPFKGPYTVVKVSTNGTVCVQHGAVTQRVNVRRLMPYHTRDHSGGG
jgi:hypothetical protein